MIAINSLLINYYIFTSFVIKPIFSFKFTVPIFGRKLVPFCFALGCIDLVEQFLLILLDNSLALELFVMIVCLPLLSSTFIIQMCFLCIQILVQMLFSLADDHVVLTFQSVHSHEMGFVMSFLLLFSVFDWFVLQLLIISINVLMLPISPFLSPRLIPLMTDSLFSPQFLFILPQPQIIDHIFLLSDHILDHPSLDEDIIE